MSHKYKFRDQNKLYFVSFATVAWVDVFTRRIYKDIIIDSLHYCMEHKGLELYVWCIMTNHVHLIIGTHQHTLEAIMRDLKRHTSKQVLQAIQDNNQESRKEWIIWIFKRAGQRNPNNSQFQFWQQGNHPIELSDRYRMQQKLDYIHYNPVEAGFVAQPEEYLYSSARDYAGIKGLLDIWLIE